MNSVDAYDYSFKPGTVDESGNFRSWLSDAEYQAILGETSYDFNTWRTDFRKGDFDLEGLTSELINARIPEEGAREIAEYLLQDGTGNERIYFDGEVDGRQVTGMTFAERKENNKVTMRVIIDNEQTWNTPVTRVDAFIYANQRIAGKTSMQALEVNGGIVAREIGILAPGRRTSSWWTGNGRDGDRRYRDLRDADNACGVNADARYQEGGEFYTPNAEDCAFTVNYDHRLRNGGYGFNLVEGTIGMTLSWQLADRIELQVKP